ncbi:F-box only protein 5 [Hippoglossus hippoglossus]|uniref:F-box only protein 5 n=1 Tax=Hippoglossus hippoglossus TaxID=8267 RepID=UPI00148B9444|nr:F-box only protein 5 [Hippoglossus hippoglossus]XP_034463968.1 F-box only protein 5 [Hippoglossus hippoglossus]XP_034463969.1 F-box only protein 5 [Hippoglossus hippoglossus]
MKCPRYDTTRVCNMEKSADTVAAVGAKVPHVKASPVKEPVLIKPQFPPAAVTRVLFSLNNDTRPVHNKENSSSREHDRTLDEGLEDSGYVSLQNSQIDEHHGDEEDDHSQGRSRASLPLSATHQERTISPNSSPAKCKAGHSVSVVAASTPVNRPRRRILSSTPCDSHSDPNLPILKFQRAVCEELAKNYRKNKRYDWSIVDKVAEDHVLDRVIGRQMGREYVDMFANLLSRNMRNILSNILALLGDMDLISCKRVSRTWRRIIGEDTTSTNRCLQTEESIRESMSSLRQHDCGLTRDVGVSRVVLSCIQTRASSTVSSSSSTSSRVHRRITTPQKGNTPHSQFTRFTEFIQAADSLKQHQSLRCCKRCGSPATHSAEIQRATCTRLNCLFDFCTCCQETFHGLTSCRTVESRSHFVTSRATPVLPGSARSKRNIRRL